MSTKSFTGPARPIVRVARALLELRNTRSASFVVGRLRDTLRGRMSRDVRIAPKDPNARLSQPTDGPLQLVEVASRRGFCHALPPRGAVAIGRSDDARVSIDGAVV